MWYPDEGQAQYEADMNAQAEYEMQMEAEMAAERNKIIEELEAEIQIHEYEINKLQKQIENLKP